MCVWGWGWGGGGGGEGVTGDNNHMSSTRLRLFYALELRTKMF